jgi:hypothetical protein
MEQPPESTVTQKKEKDSKKHDSQKAKEPKEARVKKPTMRDIEEDLIRRTEIPAPNQKLKD